MATSTSSTLPSILSYCMSSIIMTLTNKLVLSSYEFHCNFLLLAIQSIIILFMLEASTYFNLISHRKFNIQEAKKWFIVTCALISMIYTGSKALQYMPVPLFTVFKNLTIVVIAFGEYYWFNGSPVTGLILTSFSMMVGSSIIAGWDNISSGQLKDSDDDDGSSGILVAYFWMTMNVVATAFNALVMRRKIRTFQFSDFDTQFYNNLLSIPVLLVASLVVETGEIQKSIVKYSGDASGELNGLLMGITLSGVCGFAISYCSSWCLRVTSSTTYSFVGSLNKLPISIFGMLMFGDPITFGSVSGVLIAFGGGLTYSYAKNIQSKEAQQHTLPLSKQDGKKALEE